MKKSLVALTSILLLVLSSCGVNSVEQLSVIQSAVQSSFHDCNFEPLEITDAVVGFDDLKYEQNYLVYPLTDLKSVYGNGSGKAPTGEKFLPGESGIFFVCNTEGIKLSNVRKYSDYVSTSIEDITGMPGSFCWGPWEPKANDLIRLRKCWDYLQKSESVGVWFTIQEFKNSDAAKKQALKIARDNQGYYSDYPIAYQGVYVFMFTGQIRGVTQSYVEDIDNAWLEIIDKTGAKLVSDEIPGYTKVYDFEDAYDSKVSHCGFRCDIGKGMERWGL
jgi:hypothetical protein